MKSPTKKRLTTTIRLSEEMNEQLKVKAEEVDLSKNAWILMKLREALAEAK